MESKKGEMRQVRRVLPRNAEKPYAAGEIFQVDVITALGGAMNYMDLFGWLKDA